MDFWSPMWRTRILEMGMEMLNLRRVSLWSLILLMYTVTLLPNSEVEFDVELGSRTTHI